MDFTRKERLTQIYNAGFRSGFKLFDLGSSDSPLNDNSILELAQRAKISESSLVIEPGCGSGGVSRLLAKTYGCQVAGIDLVPFQLKIARSKLVTGKLRSLISYTADDVVDFDYEKNTFDVSIDIFAWVHIADWQELFNKMFFTLKPGGRIMMYDAFITPETSNETLQEVREKWFDPGICTIDSCRNMLEKSGFHIIYCEEKRMAVLNCWKSGFKRLTANRARFENEWGRQAYKLFSATIEYTIVAHEQKELTAAAIVAEAGIK